MVRFQNQINSFDMDVEFVSKRGLKKRQLTNRFKVSVTSYQMDTFKKENDYLGRHDTQQNDTQHMRLTCDTQHKRHSA